MIWRATILAAGLMGGAVTSQWPEFSQQYVQRLGGAADALAVVVADFDRSASAAGLSRDEALTQLQGTPFLDRRRADMEAVFARHARLQSDLDALSETHGLRRMVQVHRFRDAEVARATWAVYRPALPLTVDGLLSALVGFFAASGLIRGALAVLSRLRRPRRA